MKTSKAKSSKAVPAPVAEPKRQIPSMMQALRRQSETARALIEALESKLGPVLRAAKSSKAVPAPVAEPKRQIPSMMQALRRQRETARALIEALESKLGSVLRAPDEPPTATPETVRWANAAPVASALMETVDIQLALNARLRDITARLEL